MEGDSKPEFYNGQMLGWVHGDHHRIAYVIAVDEEMIKVAGETRSYWITKKAMRKKLARPYPVPVCLGA